LAILANVCGHRARRLNLFAPRLNGQLLAALDLDSESPHLDIVATVSGLS
jgi:hypothetical protein